MTGGRHTPPDALGLAPARLSWADGVPRAEDYGDVYFSSDGGLAEAEYVFLGHNRLTERFSRWTQRRAFVIGETGFGSGLNVLCAQRLFLRRAPAGARLHLVSIEKHPLTAADLARALTAWPVLAAAGQALIAQWPAAVRGIHRLVLHERVTLDLHFDEAAAALHALDARVDAWFLDGFAPRRNPAMWRPEIFEALAAASRPKTTFATFSCAGDVRRGLSAAGFTCEKVPGFGRKQTMLRGRFDEESASVAIMPARARTPWFVPAAPVAAGERVAVVGAGIAGASAAHALARRGRRVTIFDPQGPGGGASGNRQAALYIRLAVEANAQTRFYLAALQYTVAFLARFDPDRELWRDCGLLQLATTAREAERQRRCAANLGLPKTLLRWLDRAAAREAAGCELAARTRGALYYPTAGWVFPGALCRALSARDGIRLRRARVRAVIRGDASWAVCLANGERLCFDHVVLACADQGRGLSPDMPEGKIVRGQVTEFRLDALDRACTPRTVVCADGYVPPAVDGMLSVGAGFSPGDGDAAVRAAEDDDNRARIAGALPALGARLASRRPAGSRVGHRHTSPDRLPYIGPLPDSAAWRSDYAALAYDATRIPPIAGRHAPGLWTSSAHGSRGFVSAPLAAELIASRICDEPLPLAAELVDRVHPGRLLIRDLIRGRSSRAGISSVREKT